MASTANHPSVSNLSPATISKAESSSSAEVVAITNADTDKPTLSTVHPSSPTLNDTLSVTQHVQPLYLSSSESANKKLCQSPKVDEATLPDPSMSQSSAAMSNLAPFSHTPVTSVVHVSNSPEKSDTLWISSLGLYFRDKNILQSTDWLNDNIIGTSQAILSKQSNGKILGWQSTQCSKRKAGFKLLPPRSAFIQVLHVRGNHWVLASNINPRDGTSSTDSVCIYDSNCTLTVDLDTKMQICSFVQPQSDIYIFDLMNVQSQPNLSDCRLFAIASAIELVEGGDPLVCQWDSSQMRHHLLCCLEQGKLQKFPCTRQRRIRFGSRVRKSIREKIFCICRMPNDKTKGMTECTRCFKWYHNVCVQLQESEESLRNVQWICTACRSLVKIAAQ